MHIITHKFTYLLFLLIFATGNVGAAERAEDERTLFSELAMAHNTTFDANYNFERSVDDSLLSDYNSPDHLNNLLERHWHDEDVDIDELRVVESDSLALIALYNATDGPNWINAWDLTEPVSSWHGITVCCEVITSIVLSENNLTGSLPHELGNLNSLEQLVLWGNHLAGPIPAELALMNELKSLILSYNQLSGTIPPELALLVNLEDLWLGNNQITGTIPPELSALPNLRTIILGSNQLTGPIPPELGELSGLESLWLMTNQLSGSIPPELAELVNLRSLCLRENQLSGPIPPELGYLINLEGLQLQDNQLTGSIPSSFEALSSLDHFLMWRNYLFCYEDPPEFVLDGSIPIQGINQQTCIYPPVLIEPANNDTISQVLPIFTWSSMEENIGFTLSLWATALDTVTYFTYSDTLFQSSLNLMDSTSYFWQVSYTLDTAIVVSEIFQFTVNVEYYVSLGDECGQENLPILVPVNVNISEGNSYRSAELNFTGYHEGLEFVGIITEGSLSGDYGWTYIENENDSHILTAFAGTIPIIEPGVLFYLEFIPDEGDNYIVPIDCDYAKFDSIETNSIVHGSVLNTGAGLTGDVDGNGTIEALDASEILMNLIDDTYLDCVGLGNAQVYSDGIVDGMDATMILRYLVGLEASLPVTPANEYLASAGVRTEDQSINQESAIQIPIIIDNSQNIYSFDALITYDPTILVPTENVVTWSNLIGGCLIQIGVEDGAIHLAGVNPSSLDLSGTLATLEFSMIDVENYNSQTEVTIETIKLNSNLIIEGVSSIITPVVSVEQASLPVDCILNQNYPNPFNPSTTIRYGLPENSNVSLIIYDIRGNAIRTMNSGACAAGWYEHVWNGKDNAGLSVSTGLYLTKLSAGGYTKTIKMLYLK